MKSTDFKSVNHGCMKKDAMQLLLGKPVYLDDITSGDCLVVKVLRSPYAHALIEEINTEKAMLVKGIECIFTYKDVPNNRYTVAGQTYPEASPYDRLILDKRLRFVGDAVAVVAGEDEKAVDKALKLIKVKYNVLEPVLDYKKAKDNPILVHPEEEWKSLFPVGADNKRNLCATGEMGEGDIEEVFKNCDIVLERSYHTKACQQAMMETFRTYCEIDKFGRLHVNSSTQIIFHVQRIIANALDIPKSRVRVSKPRVGGGFGAKQSVVAEVYPALVTWKTKKPSKMIYSRYETQIAASPRHEMEINVKMGADKDGTIKAIDIYTLSNSGAYGEHGPTTVGLSAEKTIPLYTKNLQAFHFSYDVVYTNLQASGAYRGYGAPQGMFAVESCVNELAQMLDIDPVYIREKNMVREGDIMNAYHHEVAKACALDKCMARCKEMFDWDAKAKPVYIGNNKVRAAGVAMAMQGSGISHVDVGSATIKLCDEGAYYLNIGAADMGTGCDTILAQIAAESLSCDVTNVIVAEVDSDHAPYDSGSYASSTTYVTGMAVVKAAEDLKSKILNLASEMMGLDVADLLLSGKEVVSISTGKALSLMDICTKSMCGSNTSLVSTASNSSEVSPPPYMVGMAEIEIDMETGDVELINYTSVVDCGTTINPNLARVQAEGGIVQGIGMALFENVTHDRCGRTLENSLMQYKIPARVDVGKINVEFVSSYEPTGPYGAKSIGEIVINTPSPAIAHAIANATKVWHRELPITKEKILMSMINR